MSTVKPNCSKCEEKAVIIIKQMPYCGKHGLEVTKRMLKTKAKKKK